MKVLINILCLSSLLSVCIAQTTNPPPKENIRPDLSGVWVLDDSRSNINSVVKEKIVEYILTIVHREPEIRMTTKYKRGTRDYMEDVTYYTNGKPEFNSRTGQLNPEPTTGWKGDKLVRKSHSSLSMRPIEYATTEEWQLSADGKTLTRTIVSGPIKLKYVFSRSS